MRLIALTLPFPRILARVCRPFYAWRITAPILLFLLLLFLLTHRPRSNSPQNNEPISGRKSSRAATQIRWTSWDSTSSPSTSSLGGGSGAYLPSGCAAQLPELPTLEVLERMLEHHPGALVFPYFDEETAFWRIGKPVCGWVLVKGQGQGAYTEGRSHHRKARRRGEDSSKTEDSAPYEVFPGWPEHSIRITAIGRAYGFEIPVEHVHEPALKLKDRRSGVEYTLYEFGVVFRDPDVYTFEAVLDGRICAQRMMVTKLASVTKRNDLRAAHIASGAGQYEREVDGFARNADSQRSESGELKGRLSLADGSIGITGSGEEGGVNVRNPPSLRSTDSKSSSTSLPLLPPTSLPLLPLTPPYTSTPLNLHLKGKPLTRSTYLGLPFCTSGDHPGRWVNASLLTAPPLLWESEEDRTHEDLADVTRLKTYDGLVWVPYECRYRLWTYRTIRDKCLRRGGVGHGVVHIWGGGDVGVRRGVKGVVSGGAWCREWYQEDSPQCQCNDTTLPVPNVPSTTTDTDASEGIIPGVMGGSGTMYFNNRDGGYRDLLERMQGDALGERLRDLKPEYGTVGEGVEVERASAVILNPSPQIHTLLHDTLTTTFLPTYIKTLRKTYPNAPSLILRTSTSASSLRTKSLNNILGRTFTREFLDDDDALVLDINSAYSGLGMLGGETRPIRPGRLHVWDVAALREGLPKRARKRREEECGEDGQEGVGRDLVEWESLVLMNVLCNWVLEGEDGE
ncbi:hypothetical protein HDV00_005289 [Rhizophlyctis rosea]|nr:hypothetical protein HDV00_005289 [Rhizophlyctis rosea]